MQAKIDPSRAPKAKASAPPPAPPRTAAVSPVPNPFGIVADENSPTARVTGRGTSGVGVARKRRKNNKMMVGGLLLLLLGLAVAAVVLAMLPKKPIDDPNQVAAVQSDTPKDADTLLEGEGPETPDATDTAGSGADPSAAASDDSSSAKWIDASKSAIERGAVKVKIASVIKGFPELSRPLKNPELQLIITFELYNRDSRRKLDYISWSQHTRENLGVKLTDDAGNSYRLQTYRLVTVEGQQDDTSIYPRESVKDLLVFERPIDNLEELLLELPAAAFGEPGTLYFRIPKEMITEQAGSSKDPDPEELFGDDAMPDDRPGESPDNTPPTDTMPTDNLPGNTAEEDVVGDPGVAPLTEEPPPRPGPESNDGMDDEADQLRRDYPDLFNNDDQDGANQDGANSQDDGFEGKFDKFNLSALSRFDFGVNTVTVGATAGLSSSVFEVPSGSALLDKPAVAPQFLTLTKH